jgi:hypothetical protein
VKNKQKINNNNKKKKKKNVAKPEIYTYNANRQSSNNGIQYHNTKKSSVPGKFRAVLNTDIHSTGKNQSGTQYRYSVPEKIRAVLNTGIRYRKKI